jgi:hypothetical protein
MAIIRRGKILASCAPRQETEQLNASIWEANVSRDKVSALKSHCHIISSQMSDGRRASESDFQGRATRRRIFARQSQFSKIITLTW